MLLLQLPLTGDLQPAGIPFLHPCGYQSLPASFCLFVFLAVLTTSTPASQKQSCVNVKLMCRFCQSRYLCVMHARKVLSLLATVGHGFDTLCKCTSHVRTVYNFSLTRHLRVNSRISSFLPQIGVRKEIPWTVWHVMKCGIPQIAISALGVGKLGVLGRKGHGCW